jgi:hypothetical protein
MNQTARTSISSVCQPVLGERYIIDNRTDLLVMRLARVLQPPDGVLFRGILFDENHHTDELPFLWLDGIIHPVEYIALFPDKREIAVLKLAPSLNARQKGL